MLDNEGHGRKIERAAKKNNCLIKNDVENLVKLSRKKQTPHKELSPCPSNSEIL
jgi:hypothetical protein